MLAGGAWAQGAAPRPPPALVNTPIPEGDIAAVIRDMALTESARPVREMIQGWKKPGKILVFVDNNANRLAWFQEVAPGVKLVAIHNRDEAMAQIADADGEVMSVCNKARIQAGKSLHWIQTNSIGVDECFYGDVPPQISSGQLVVTNLKHVLSPVVGYHAIAMAVALSRGLDLFVRMNQSGHTDPEAIPPGRLWDVDGRTLLVVGLGGVGTDVARLAHGLGMKVIATRETSHQGPDYVEYVGLSGELPELIGRADVVVMAAPLTAATNHLFDAAMFARMKRGALFINIARGEQVVTADLAAALRSGQLGGAGLDVVGPPRLADNDPLYNVPNIIITPHVADHAVEDAYAKSGEMSWQLARENLRRYVAGERLLSVVDPALGY